MTVEQYLKSFTGVTSIESKRSNLRDLACPDCGQRRALKIRAEVWVDVYSSSIDIDEEYEEPSWVSSAMVECPECSFTGPLHKFRINGLDEALERNDNKPCQQQ